MAGASPAAAMRDEAHDALAAVRAAEARRVEVLARAAKAVVCVFSDRQRGGGGSGVVIDPAGYGLTNFHVVQPFIESRRGFGGLSDGRLYPLRVLGIDPGGDVAMFKLEGKDHFDYAPLGDSDALRVGQWVAAMGNPFMLAEDFSPTVTLGVISGLHRYQKGQGNLLEYADCIQVSTSINPGNSGGPLFDLDSRVIGINGRASFEERGRVNVGLGYAVSINQIKRVMPSLWAGRLVEHGTLGATVRGIGGELLVSAIQAFSAAERAGVQLGDELLELAGRRLRTPNDYNNLLATLPANWPVRLKLRRNGQLLDATARLDRLPLRMPLLYVVDIEHNHAELAKLLDRHAQTVYAKPGMPPAKIVFARPVGNDGAAGDRLFAVAVSEKASTAPSLAFEPRPEGVIGRAVVAEWRNILQPLFARSKPDLNWELLAGDEVRGRIAGVIERRFEDGRHIRWKLDWQTAELLQVALGDEDETERVVWTPRAPTPFGEVFWPREWTRRTRAGQESVFEIES
ncbi:MAG: S1C family serine protease, partial [Phycisphaerae bacterium]